MIWHTMLKMPKKDKNWHKNDISDELQEYHEAKGVVNKWSELSDVAYTYSRAKWSGHKINRPISRIGIATGYVYMLPKYTLRYAFFRIAGKPSGVKMREVRNPRKVHKLEHIARKYEISPDEFINKCQKQLKYWPLLP